MFRHLAAGLLLATATPAWAQENGGYERAVAARLEGAPATAIALLEPLVAAEPDNADARLQLGLSYLALDRLDEAQMALDETLRIAPDYADARIALARIAQRRGDIDTARRHLGAVPADDAEAVLLRRALHERAQWRADLDAGYSTLVGPAPDWRELAIALTRQSAATSIGGRVEWHERFEIEDVFGELRIEQRLNARASAYFAAGGTPDADFRPQWQVSAGGRLQLGGRGAATVLTLDARQARYQIGDIQTVTPGIEHYLADGRVWLTGQWINIFDERGDHRMGYLLRADAQASDRVRLFAGLADAPDPDQGVVVDTTNLFGGVAVTVGAQSELRAVIAHEDRSIGANRTQFSLGVGWRF